MRDHKTDHRGGSKQSHIFLLQASKPPSLSILLDRRSERIHLGAVCGHCQERGVVCLELGLVDHGREEPVLDPVKRLGHIDRSLPRDAQVAIAGQPGVEVAVDGIELWGCWSSLVGALIGKRWMGGCMHGCAAGGRR